MDIEELKILLAIEPVWTVSLNGLEFQTIPSAEMAINGNMIQCGKWIRRVEKVEWLRPNVVRVAGRQKLRAKTDTLTLYPGEKLPPGPDLRRRRRAFQTELGEALCRHFGERAIQRQILHADRSHAIGAAYPRYIIGKRAAIAVDPDESSVTVSGIMRAALLWSLMIRRRITVVTPKHRSGTLARRLQVMPQVGGMFDWMQWDGESLSPFDSFPGDQPETEVREFAPPASETVETEVQRILEIAPDLLRAIPHIAGNAISIRLHGIEIACVKSNETIYPLGQPLADVVAELAAVRHYGSRHPLARAHEERWLESNIIDDIERILPSVDSGHVYPQVPSFAGEERNIIDLLTVTHHGRLVVMEIKASADPDLPFQALDYWIAVERHRAAGDFQRKGYFKGVHLTGEPAILVLVAPLLAFHRTLGRLRGFLPRELPMIEIGLNQSWKKEIQILRRRGLLS